MRSWGFSVFIQLWLSWHPRRFLRLRSGSIKCDRLCPSFTHFSQAFPISFPIDCFFGPFPLRDRTTDVGQRVTRQLAVPVSLPGSPFVPPCAWEAVGEVKCVLILMWVSSSGERSGGEVGWGGGAASQRKGWPWICRGTTEHQVAGLPLRDTRPHKAQRHMFQRSKCTCGSSCCSYSPREREPRLWESV